MSALKEAISEIYGFRPRMRVCGICMQEEEILLIKHKGIGTKGFLWALPGGGVDFGESLHDTLIREFKEETGLEIEVGEFLFINEYIHSPLHAIELFFEVKIKNGVLSTGTDPEMPAHQQLLGEVEFMDVNEILADDKAYYHDLFKYITKAGDILKLKGYYSAR